MQIYNEVIEPGECKTLKIPIASLPSSTSISLFAHVFRSKNPGPTMLVLGGVHGDEINGVEIVRRAVKSKMFNDLLCGSVIAIPVLNVYGFINFSREFPDGKDVNRSFPGSSKGSLASRIAHSLSKHILPNVDFGIDFHTGGDSIFNYPQVRVSNNDSVSLDIAKVFSCPFIVKSNLISKSLRKESDRLKIPILVYEGGESLRLDEYSILEGINGLKRILKHKKMKNYLSDSQNSILINKNSWIRAPKAGIFISSIKAGDKVKVNEKIGKITDPYGLDEVIIKSSKNGYVYGLNNKPVVNAGDAIVHVGYDLEYINNV